MTLKARLIPCLEKRPPIARRQRFSFSPTGRRWPEGPDEGACPISIVSATPSSRCRDLLPAGEKEAGRALHVQGPAALPRVAQSTAQPRSGEDAQNEKMEAVL